MITPAINFFKSTSDSAVFWLTLSLAVVISPHIIRFPVWATILIIILFLWRIFNISHPRWQPPKWFLLVITVISFAGIYLSFGTLFGKTAGSVLLSILLAVKLHESQTIRDYMLVISLCFFIIVTNFLFSQSIPTVIYMLLAIIILLISMLSINQGTATASLDYKFKFATKILMQSIPLMLIMFLLFPRISGPLWRLPDEKVSAQSGLSEQMSPGDISNLIQSNRVAFRVKFDNTIPPQNKLYWRALVLWSFDGRTWQLGKDNPSPLATLHSPSSHPVSYSITLEPHNKTWLYALDVPFTVPDSIYYTNNYNLRAQQKIISLYQYQVSSVLKYFIQTSLPPWEKNAGLKIPLNTNPKTLKMAQQLTQQYTNAEDIIKHVLQFFNQQDFHYTLRPPLTPGLDSVDQFLFDTKRGFCEHYASSFTLLMRAAGIPARIVMGFQGGTVNPLNNIMTVRNSDAHAWSEVWLENQGWVRIDPTAAIAPQRIESSLQAALDPAEIRPFHMQMNSGFMKDILFYWDAIDNQWNQWVVGYDKDFQQEILEKLLHEKFSFSNIVLLMVVSFSLMTLVFAFFIIQPFHKQKLDPVIKVYNAFCHKLAAAGIARAAHEGPIDYANRAVISLPEHKNSIRLITHLYTKLRFEASHNERQFKQFEFHVRKFKRMRINL